MNITGTNNTQIVQSQGVLALYIRCAIGTYVQSRLYGTKCSILCKRFHIETRSNREEFYILFTEAHPAKHFAGFPIKVGYLALTAIKEHDVSIARIF